MIIAIAIFYRVIVFPCCFICHVIFMESHANNIFPFLRRFQLLSSTDGEDKTVSSGAEGVVNQGSKASTVSTALPSMQGPPLRRLLKAHSLSAVEAPSKQNTSPRTPRTSRPSANSVSDERSS